MTDAALLTKEELERIKALLAETIRAPRDSVGDWAVISGQRDAVCKLLLAHIEAMEALLAAERERCAKIAEAETRGSPLWAVEIGQDIAAAIRAGKKT